MSPSCCFVHIISTGIVLLDRLRLQVLPVLRGRSGLRTAEETGGREERAHDRQEGHATQRCHSYGHGGPGDVIL